MIGKLHHADRTPMFSKGGDRSAMFSKWSNRRGTELVLPRISDNSFGQGGKDPHYGSLSNALPGVQEFGLPRKKAKRSSLERH